MGSNPVRIANLWFISVVCVERALFVTILCIKNLAITDDKRVYGVTGGDLLEAQ